MNYVKTLFDLWGLKRNEKRRLMKLLICRNRNCADCFTMRMKIPHIIGIALKKRVFPPTKLMALRFQNFPPLINLFFYHSLTAL